MVLTVGIVGTVLLNRQTYTTLYSGLSAQEAGTIITLLGEKGVKAKAQGTDTILVPEAQADELRIQLAAQGLPNTGLNYDLFSSASSIGSTDLERQTYLQYQLQENMRATIKRMDKVSDCIVIVNLATTSSFVMSSNVSDATVAVMLSLEKGEKLSDEEARTIGAFVLKCVPKLKVENVSIVDSAMNYYDVTGKEDEKSLAEYSDVQQQLTEQMKSVLSQQVLRVLEPAMGAGNVAVSVNLSLDFDRKTIQSVEFSPPVEGETQGILRSSEELYDAVRSANEGLASVGTDSNGVSAPSYAYGDENNDLISESYSKTYNYELNEVKTQIERAQGAVQDLTVAVVVNSQVSGIEDYVEQVRSLVAGAIGVDSGYISVELLPFIQKAGDMDFEDYFRQNQEAMKELSRMNLIRTAIVAGALLLAVFMVLFFLHRRKVKAEEAAAEAAAAAAAERSGEELLTEEKEEQERLLVELMNQKSDEAERAEELMERYPEAAVQILRTWLMEDR
ncbi:Flagellar M-ring protein [bioreactor metagenome]|uniref:Flagellar M-ring protein n=1 Tax=bioreactor metagenome TaxID=1076179 RepID=A0A644ZB89_9ZZZZ